MTYAKTFGVEYKEITTVYDWPIAQELFKKSYMQIRDCKTYDLHDLKSKYPKIWKQFTESVYALIKCMMYQYTTIKDKEGNIKKISVNTEKIKSLCTNGLEVEEIANDLMVHILKKSVYYIYESNDAVHAINMIRRSTSWRICDMVKDMNLLKKNFPSESEFDEEQHQKALNSYEDCSLEDFEKSMSLPIDVEIAKNEFLQSVVKKLMEKHPERMVAYINSICQRKDADLLHDIKEFGYNDALLILIDKAKSFEIDLEFLKKCDLVYKKSPDSLVTHDIENWKTRAYHSIKDDVKEFIKKYNII